MNASGSQGQPVRVPAGDHLPLEVQLVRPYATTPTSCTRTCGSASTSAARLSRAGISSIDIERKGDQIWVFIRTARPGIVIGRKGAEVDRLRKDIERYTKKRVDVKVEDMNQAASESRPETDAALLAQGVAEQLVGRVAFRRAMRRAVQTAMRAGASACGSRPAGGWVAPRCRAASGTARAGCRCTRSARRWTTARPRRRRRSGEIGVKVWVYHGDQIPDREQATERALARARVGARRTERREDPRRPRPTAEPSSAVAVAEPPVAEQATPEVPAVEAPAVEPGRRRRQQPSRSPRSQAAEPDCVPPRDDG